MRVQKLMALVAQGFLQEFGIDLLYRRIFVGFPEFLSFILGENGLHTGLANLVVGKAGLSSSSDASSGTGHDFHEVERFLAFVDFFQKFGSASQGMGHREAGGYAFQEVPFFFTAGDGDFRDFHSFQSCQRLHVKVLHGKRGAGNDFPDRPQGPLP